MTTSLEDALAALGVPCAVDVEQRLAILRPMPHATGFTQLATRTRIVALAREHGFTHVALDLADIDTTGERTGAVVSGD